MNNDRFKDAEWLKIQPRVLVIGLGGIGSHTVNLLVRTVDIDSLTLVDPDMVEPVNLGTQNYTIFNLGDSKVSATRNVIHSFFPLYRCTPCVGKIEELIDKDMEFPKTADFLAGFQYDMLSADIIICAVDSMKVRKFLYEYLYNLVHAVKYGGAKLKLPLYIDGRLNATSYEIFTISNISKEGEYEKLLNSYGVSLVAEDTLGEGSCTMRQTFFMGAMIGARITQIITNYLTNLYYKKQCEEVLHKPYTEICKVPFHIRELGEGVIMNKTTSLDYELKMQVYRREE